MHKLKKEKTYCFTTAECIFRTSVDFQALKSTVSAVVLKKKRAY